MILSVFVPIIPVAKARPRFVRMGRFMRAYTAEKTADYEQAIKLYLTQHRPAAVPEGALKIVLTFHMPKPKAWRGAVFHVKRPDLDNLVKAVMDAMHGGWFKDDAQIAALSCSKVYSDQPGVQIDMGELSD